MKLALCTRAFGMHAVHSVEADQTTGVHSTPPLDLFGNPAACLEPWSGVGPQRFGRRARTSKRRTVSVLSKRGFGA